MDQCMLEIAPASSAPGMSAFARNLSELARWGRLAGRLDARWEVLRGPRAELTHGAAFRRSAIWAELDEAGQRIFDLAYFQAWTEWMASCRNGAPAVAAR